MTYAQDDTGDVGDVTDEPGANEPDDDDEEYTGDANPAYDEDDDTAIEPVYDDDNSKPWWA